ncbi:hypothetical protein [Streptomyces caniferus]|uniref:hypothetical protein n=1 Tax=Streptomyces caniferus TaxID=285557 RepID=UPI0037FD0593
MIAKLHRASSTAEVLGYLYGPGEGGNHSNPRLIAGDVHGAPMAQRAGPDSVPDLARTLDAPVERLGARAPRRPVWVCSVRSDPRRPDLADSQWATVARRLVAATGIAPDGDPDACRWVAVRTQPQQLYVVATLARENGGLHNGYRDAFRLHSECHVLSDELGHRPTPSHPTPHAQETLVPAPPITITSEFSGSVVAQGANDDLSARLLKHAGFQQIEDWHGRRHRLPTTTPVADKVAIASHAAEMLRAAHYDVDLPPSLDAARISPPAPDLGPYAAGAELLRITDRIRAAENCDDLQRAVHHLLHPEHGALERVREALEAAGEQIEALEVEGEQIHDLDNEATDLAYRFDYASEYVRGAQSELVNSEAKLRRIGTASQDQARTQSSELPDHRGAALATSPAAAKAKVSSALGSETAQSNAAVHPPRASGPRR